MGLLDKGRVFVDEHRLRVVGPAGGAGRRVDALEHHANAFVAIDEDMPLTELLDVSLRAADGERCRCEEAVARATTAALTAANETGTTSSADQRDQPLDRRPNVASRSAQRIDLRNGMAAHVFANAVPRDPSPGLPLLDAPAYDVAACFLLRAGLLLDQQSDSTVARASPRTPRRPSSACRP